MSKQLMHLGRLAHTTDEVTRILGKLLGDPHDEVASGAGVSLFGLGEMAKPAHTDLLKAIVHSNPKVNSLAIGTLSFIGHDAVIAKPLLEVLRDNEDKQVCYWSEQALMSSRHA